MTACGRAHPDAGKAAQEAGEQVQLDQAHAHYIEDFQLCSK
jgi:hypothetical protein